jgi:hypothetical protein
MAAVARRWRRPGPLTLTIGAVVAFFLQLVAMVLLGAQWAGYYDVMRGGCGWDGTCSDAGSVAVTIWGLLGVVAAELAVSFVLAKLAWRRRRTAGREAVIGSVWGVRLAVAVMIGCAAACLLGVQGGIIGRLGDVGYPGIMGTQMQGRFFVSWSTRLLAVEVGLAVLISLLVHFFRNTRLPFRPPSAS